LVLLLACETLLPTIGFLPVTMQTRDMAVSDNSKASEFIPKSCRAQVAQHVDRVFAQASMRRSDLPSVNRRLPTSAYSVI
jgi:hypothetical protein